MWSVRGRRESSTTLRFSAEQLLPEIRKTRAGADWGGGGDTRNSVLDILSFRCLLDILVEIPSKQLDI